jgi:deoxyribodipyrimidine photo-lyase
MISAKTGFLIIDAAIMEMKITGFLHNRCRMIVASYLTKDMHIDWREGEKFYSNNLVDIDAMVNNNSWQWCAGSGTDAQPYFRIFNPWTQLKTYDPELKYVREYIPELKDVPDKDILNWWKPEIHEKWLKEGIQYFKPILDHSEEAKNAIKIYKEAL